MLFILIALTVNVVTNIGGVSIDNYQYVPVRSVNYPYGTTYVYQSAPYYENVRKYSDVSSNDFMYQGRDINVNRADTDYNYRYGQWPTRTTEATQYNRYNNRRKTSNAYDYVRQTTERIRIEGANENDKLNTPVNDRNIKKQSDDVYKYPDKQQNNSYNKQRNQNGNTETVNATLNTNKTISVQILNGTNSSRDQGSMTLYHIFVNNTTKTNMNNKTVNTNNNMDNSSYIDKYDGKTTSDNEVTKSYGSSGDEDRWVWANGDENNQTTTLIVPLDDRAAFSGNNCPTGKVKINDSCVVPD